jgi:hypothetical protein
MACLLQQANQTEPSRTAMNFTAFHELVGLIRLFRIYPSSAFIRMYNVSFLNVTELLLTGMFRIRILTRGFENFTAFYEVVSFVSLLMLMMYLFVEMQREFCSNGPISG